MSKELKIGIIGCGLIGERRVEVACRLGLGRPVLAYDTSAERLQKVSEKYGVTAARGAGEIVEKAEIDIVVVATPNHLLAEIGVQALRNGKHVLLEKPGATRAEQVDGLIAAQGKHGLVAKIGYNHRFHPAAQRLTAELASGRHGRLLWIRGAYGHGGRPGYEKEWRFDRRLSGGGEIIDQGVHLLDLLQACSRERFDLQFTARQNAFYRSSEEDNGFLMLRAPSGATAQLHCSVTQWKNLFRWEVATESALLCWDGLGNPNYGAERLTIYRRKPQGGAPDCESVDLGLCGMESWEAEWRHFYAHCETGNPQVDSSARDSRWLFDVITAIQEKSPVYAATEPLI